MWGTVRARLTAWYVTALATTLLLAGTVTFLLSRASLYDWLDNLVTARAERLAGAVRLEPAGPVLDLPPQMLRSYEGVKDGFTLLDGRGRPVLTRGLDHNRFDPAQGIPVVSKGERGTGTVTEKGGRRWRIAWQRVGGSGSRSATLVVARDLDELDSVTSRLAAVRTIIYPLALLFTGVWGLVLAGRALSPVEQIRRAAAEISEKDLSRRLRVVRQDELGRLAATFNELFERLQRAFERERQFTADASHELRTPLSLIRLETSEKLSGSPGIERYEEALRRIDAASAYMSRLLGQLLTLARADAGELKPGDEEVDLAEMLEHVAAQVGEMAGRPIAVRSNGSVLVRGDALRLAELFLNVLENAARYTPASGAVDVRVARNGSAAAVEVTDTGVGIPPGDLPHVFERFYRVGSSRSRNEGGSGLGLAIARSIAEAHGGSIEAQSEVGRGTRVTIRLPLAEEATANEAADR